VIDGPRTGSSISVWIKPATNCCTATSRARIPSRTCACARVVRIDRYRTIKNRLMNGQSSPTGAVVPSPNATFNDPELERRLPFRLDAAKKLLADAGYPNGFEFTLDCPNNRYVNDEKICVTLASQWAKLGLTVRVNAQTKCCSSTRSKSSTPQPICSAGAVPSRTRKRRLRRCTATAQTRCGRVQSGQLQG